MTMNKLRNSVATMYFLSARLSRWAAVLSGLSGLGYGVLSASMQQEVAGFNAVQLIMIGGVGTIVMGAISVACSAAGNFISGEISATENEQTESSK